MVTQNTSAKEKRAAAAKEVRAARAKATGVRFQKFMSSKIGWDRGDPIDEHDETYAEHIAKLERRLAQDQAETDFAIDYDSYDNDE